MAATSAGQQSQQQTQQPSNAGGQQKPNTGHSAAINVALTRNTQMQQQTQIHNLQQQQHLMQQYTMKQQQQQQQQNNYNMQQQQPNQAYAMQHQSQQQLQTHQATQQQMHLKMQQQQQQMFHNHNSQFASNMMPCQNFMTPPPQLHTQPNKFNNAGNNNVANNTSNWHQQYQHRKPFTIANNAKPTNNGSPRHKTNSVATAANNNQNTNNQMLQQHNNVQHFTPSSNQQQNNANVAQKTPPLQQKHDQKDIKAELSYNNTMQQHVANNNQHVANNQNNPNNIVKDLPTNLPKKLPVIELKSNEAVAEESVKGNLPAGWRRLTNNENEIVYISPTGVTLRSPFQIKDYLLSSGTCKCGLPCPLRPECCFDFNVQVPNTPLTSCSRSGGTATVYQNHNNNGFNSFNINQTTTTTNSASASASTSLPASCSPNALQNGISPASSSSSSSSSSSTSPATTPSSPSLDMATRTIPSATPSSSLTCLHQQRFQDCLQLHAQPMELFNKDDKRHFKIANTESTSMIDNNSLAVASPATTESASAATTTTSDVVRQRTSQNCKMMSTCNMEQQHQQHHHQQNQQQHQHVTNHHIQQQQHQQQPQHVITNSYNNNMMMECSNKTWAKDNRMASTHENATQQQQQQQQQTPLQQHLVKGNGNLQWTHLNAKPMSQSNMCPQQQQQQQQHFPELNNNDEQLQTSIFKDDLNGYLQRQTELMHNSMMDVQHHNDKAQHHESDGQEDAEEAEDDEVEEEEEEEEEEEDEAAGNLENSADGMQHQIEDDEQRQAIKSLKATVQNLDFLANADCLSNQAEQHNNDEAEDTTTEAGDDDENDEEEEGEEEYEEEDDEESQEDNDVVADAETAQQQHEKDATALSAEPLKQTVIEATSMETLNQTNKLLSNKTNTFFQMPNCQSGELKTANFNNIPRLTAITANKYVSYDLKTQPNQISSNNQTTQQTQPNIFVTAAQLKSNLNFVATGQESPVSSSTVAASRSTPDLQRHIADANKKPEQVGAISTSNENPRPNTPAAASATLEAINSKTAMAAKNVTSPMPSPMQQNNGNTKQQHQQHAIQKTQNQQVRIVRQIKNIGHLQQQVSQQQQLQQRTLHSNNSRAATLTTIAGNRGAAATTTTTTSAPGQRFVANQFANNTATTMTQKLQAAMQKVAAPTTNNISLNQLQLQPLLRTSTNDNSGNSQIIMTSTGQLIVMPASNNKTHLQHHHHHQQQQQHQVIIASGSATATTQTAPTTNLIIQQGDVLNTTGQLTATLQQQPNGGYIVSQSTTSANAATQLQPTTVILNSGQNLLAGNGTKVLTNTGNIIHAAGTQPILTAGNQLITAQATGNGTNVLGQQTMVLNSLPNGGYVIQQQPNQTATASHQQQYATLDSQMVSQLVQQADGSLIQNQPQRIIITSPADLKRRAKKRKNSPTPTATAAQTLNAQISPNITNQTAALLQQHAANIHAAQQQQQHQATATQPQVVQLTTATPTANGSTTSSFSQQFQLGSTGIQGIVVSKPATGTTTTQPQQILLQNGQIIQPMNLLGQQLILPTTGLVMGPDSTLLQIQNMGSCASTANILTATTPQGTMMLRATSPQTNKSFISSTATGQQFIVGSNGQLSPIGQIYSTPMGLMMPATSQHNTTPTATFVQHNGTIQVQQQHQPGTAQQLNGGTTTTQHHHHVTLQALQQHQQNLNHVVNNPVGIVLETATSSTTSPNNLQQHSAGNSRSSAASPPDTTTHSPRSPERPPSHRSGGSDMVQCVSSSEPDGGTISPLSTDSRQSPSTTVCEKGIVMSTAYQNTNIYKPSEAKIRRVQTPPQYQIIGGGNGAATNATTANNHNNNHIAGITNLTLHQHHTTAATSHNSQTLQQQPKHMDNAIKPDTHDSPQNSPTTTVMLTPPPPRTPTPLQQLHQQQQQQQQQQHFFHNSATTSVSEFQQMQQHQQQRQKTPTKQTQRNRNRSVKTTSPNTQRIVDADDSMNAISPTSSTSPLAMSLQRTFAVGELIWGPARGFPAWPGKVVKIPDNQQESVWVQWFGGGGRSNTEIMAINLLQSLSEGLEAHHKAQKDTRKSRKLNSQLEKAIQEAMTELDRISATSTTSNNPNGSKQQATSSTQHQASPNRANKRPIPRTGGYDLIAGLTANNSYTSSNAISTTTGSSNRPKPIRIAPAPPGGSPSKSSASVGAATSLATAATSSSTTATWVNSSSTPK